MMSQLSIRTIISITILLAVGVPAALSAATDKELTDKIDAVFAEFNSWDHPGVAIAVVKDGELIYKRGYGSAQLEYNIPATPSTVFHIASVSKQFTAFAIDALAEQGKLSLDDDVRKYVPELHDFGELITLRHLLNHTSGLRDQWELLVAAGWRLDDVITRDHILKMLTNQRELNFKPGERYLYCNSGYTLLAEIVSRVSGKSFPEWASENIFKPLGMSNTHFHDDHQMIVPNRAYSYYRDDDEGVIKKSVLSYANVGATSLFTTAEDLARWAQNFEEPTVGSREVLEKMQTQGVLNSGETIKYAHGIIISKLEGERMISHAGADAGFRSMLMILPEHRLSIIVLSNFAQARTFTLASKTAKLFLPAKEQPEEEAPEVEVDFAVYDDYVGKYQLESSMVVEIVRDGDHLFAETAGRPRTELFPRSDDRFFMKVADVEISFQRCEEGRVNQLTVHQSGSDTVAPRFDAKPLTPEELAEYAGEYYSAELGTSYAFEVRDGQLVATHRKHDDIPLTESVPDVFAGEKWYFSNVQFERGDQQKITGFLLTGGRVLNLRFIKR